MDLVERFWSRVDIRGEDECWEFVGYRDYNGYGKFIYGNEQLAHRVSFILSGGKFENGPMVLHSCDNPPCCSPGHLFSGTHKDNMQDMSRKGRHNKLLQSEADLIRMSSLPGCYLAQLFEVSAATVCSIKKGIRYVALA